MDFVLLAQEQPSPGEIRAVGTALRSALQRFFEAYPAWLTVPVFVVGLVALAWLFERVVLTVLRRMSARTETKVDDALAEGLPTILRPIVAVVALHVVIQQLLRDEKGALSTDGRLADKALTVVAIVVIAVALVSVASRVIDAWVGADVARNPVGPPVKLGLKIVMLPVALLAVLQAIDYPVNSLLTALGIGSLAVGLALQDTLKNMFAGVQIVLDRPIRAGDYVEVDKTAVGTVTEIGLRTTKLRSLENNIIVIPNATIAGAMVVNYDVQDRTFVQKFNVGVAYGVDTRRVQRVLEEAAAAAQKDLSGFATEPPHVTVRELGESSVNFTVEMRLRQYAGRGALVSEMYHRLYERLCAERIEIPFPTRTVYLRGESLPATAEAPPRPSP